jgi:hypothetical protein
MSRRRFLTVCDVSYPEYTEWYKGKPGTEARKAFWCSGVVYVQSGCHSGGVRKLH